MRTCDIEEARLLTMMIQMARALPDEIARVGNNYLPQIASAITAAIRQLEA